MPAPQKSSGAIYPDLAGKSVIVTGGGSGIGEAIVRAFVRQGSKVGFIDIAREPSLKLLEDLEGEDAGARYVEADIRDIPALRKALAALADAQGHADILINNAAHDERHATADVTPEFFDDRIAVNLKHAFFAAQAVLPGMQAKGGGSIVNFSSISWIRGNGGMPIYTTAKSAVQGLTRSLARDYGPFNIRVNTLVPGWVMTEKQIHLWLDEQGKEDIARGQCINRPLEPGHIARMALFLAADDSAMCTAQDFIVDGGWA